MKISDETREQIEKGFKISAYLLPVLIILLIVVGISYLMHGEDAWVNSLTCSLYRYPSGTIFPAPYYDVTDQSYMYGKMLPMDSDEFKAERLVFTELRMAVLCQCDPELNEFHMLQFTLNGEDGTVSNVRTHNGCDTGVVVEFPFRNVLSFPGIVTYQFSFSADTRNATWRVGRSTID